MEETKQAMLEARQQLDERSNRIAETREQTRKYADASRNMANTAELLKQKYGGGGTKNACTAWFK